MDVDPPQGDVTEARFLAGAEGRDERCELHDGVVVMQAGASRDHERVAKALFAVLYAQVDGDVFDVNEGDFAVRVAEGSGRGSVLYPDVLVDRQSADGDARVTTTALVVAEVLSPSTDLVHHLRKFERYKRVATLRVFLVLDPKRPVVRLWRRDGGAWPPVPTLLEGRDGVVPLPAIGARVRLADLYR